MNTHPQLVRTGVALALAGGLSAGLVSALGATPAAATDAGAETGTTTTTRERGLVLECRGKAQGLKAYVAVYENDMHGNHLQVVLGDTDDGVGNGRATRKDLVTRGHLTRAARIKVHGKVARIKGTAYKHGAKSTVHEEYDDAGRHITVEGVHRQMLTDLGMTYDGKRVGLSCDPAFGFNLKVTSESAE